MTRLCSWVPTKEELESLGFKFTDTGFANFSKLLFHITYHESNPYAKGFWVITNAHSDNFEELPVYPKSISELKLLISMMTP